MIYYTDGSGSNGLKSAYIVTDETANILEHVEHKAPGCKTNNEEEYNAVIAALKMCTPESEIRTDSQLVYHQVLGHWKCKQPHLGLLCEEARRILRDKKCTITWVPRDSNVAGILMDKM